MNRSRAPEFFSALPLLAVATLVLNDHVLKAAFHNALTGKVSDFAGCFFLPLYLSAALAFVTKWSWRRRVAIGATFTVVSFASIKVSTHASFLVTSTLELVSLPLGLGRLHVVSDPTDLLALPMIALAVLHARRSHACPAAPSS